MTRILVFKYALGAPHDWDDECEAEIERARLLWNRLVEIEAAHRRGLREAAEQDAAVAGAAARIAALDAEIAACLAERSRLRQAARAKPATPDLDAEIARLSAARRAAYGEAKAAGAAWRRANPEILAAAERHRRTLVGAARRASGLWWGNYGAVLDSYETARQRAMASGATLRWRPRDGAGRFVNRIARRLPDGRAGRHLSPAELFAGTLNQVSVAPLPPATHDPATPRGQRRRQCVTTLAITIFARYTQRRLVHFPLIMHRALPEAARITEIAVHRRRVAGRTRWSVSFTCALPPREAPAQAEPATAAACGIDLGWRKREGGLRVAYLAGSDGASAEFLLPAAWLDRMRHVEALAGRLDTMRDDIVARLRPLARLPGAAPEVAARLHDLARTPRPGGAGLAALATAWSRRREWQPDDFAALAAWRAASRRVKAEMDNLRDKLLAQRTDLYRNVAAAVVRRYGRLAIERFDLAEVAAAREALPDEARHMRQWAAVSTLRLALVQTAAREGATVVALGGATTLDCHRCRHRNQVSAAQRGDLIWRCQGCGALWDQDENAARNLLRAAVAAPAAGGEQSRTPRWQKIKAASAAKRAAGAFPAPP